jgi:hypothetical protein
MAQLFGAPAYAAAMADDDKNTHSASASGAKQQSLTADTAFAFNHACAIFSKVLDAAPGGSLTTSLFIALQPHTSRQHLASFIANVAELHHALERSERRCARKSRRARSASRSC